MLVPMLPIAQAAEQKNAAARPPLLPCPVDPGKFVSTSTWCLKAEHRHTFVDDVERLPWYHELSVSACEEKTMATTRRTKSLSVNRERHVGCDGAEQGSDRPKCRDEDHL